MREYIFRGKRVDNGEWVYGYYFKATHHWHNHGIHEDWIATDTVQNGGWCNVRGKYAVLPETVGQYTGLTDKNGKKIFEGDILVESKKRGGFDEWCYRYEVVYTSDDVGSCGCCVPEFSGIGFVFQGITGRFRGVFDEIEIIGNVHDNPELFEVAE